MLLQYYCRKSTGTNLVWDDASSITKVSNGKVKVQSLKMKIADILANHYQNLTKPGDICMNLECKCIASSTELENYHMLGGETKGIKNHERVKLENDVSNVCLKILRFLMLDGPSNTEKNLDLLYSESVKLINKQLGPEEVMVELFYPLYHRMLEPKYRILRTQFFSNDSFTYNQRINQSADGSFGFWQDENEGICYNDPQCTDTLHALTSTWQRVINVMSFNWEMDTGSMISNFNYLLDKCWRSFDELHKGVGKADFFQTSVPTWRSNSQLFTGGCMFDTDSFFFYDVIRSLTETIFKEPFNGIFVSDLIGFLGYSSTFDITSLTLDGYMSTTSNLLPIYGMDHGGWIGAPYTKHFPQCDYKVTYHRWVEYAINVDENRNPGERIFVESNCCFS